MSAQRMALKQPESYAFSKAAEKEIDGWIAKYPADRQRSALIPALWIAQRDAGGWLPEVTMRTVADKLGMAYIRVYEVATFYTMFNLAPVGEHFVQVCGTTPCWLRGSDDLKAVMARRIGPQNTVSADGKLSWLEVECLGACANAPMVQISNAQGDHYYEDLTTESFDALLDDLIAGRQPKPGPQNARHTSEPEGGAIALTDAAIYKQGRKLTKLPNQNTKIALVRHADGAKAAAPKPSSGASKVSPPKPAKDAHERSVDLKTKKKDAGKMKAPATKAANINDRKAVKDAKGKPTPDPKGTAVAAKRRTSSAVPKVLYTDGPTDGTPDDLKVIKGVGPVFEAELNEKGIYYYRQIGAWKAADVKMIESDVLTKFPGRIKRDDWVKQAKALATKTAKGKG